MNTFAKIGIAARKLALRLGIGGGGWSPNATYVDDVPSLQQTVDIFKGDWASRLPLEGVETGKAELFEDSRIRWMIDTLGSVQGMDVLELGPLEGGHSWMLEQAGAASVTAVEGNKSGYLKCLLVQQLLGMPRTRFVLGDFDRVLATTGERYGLLVASGVLYHLADPLRTLLDMMRVSDRIFIWSHFADAAAMPAGDPRRRPMTGEVRMAEHDGERMTYHVRSYLGTHRISAFCGGRESAAMWMESDEVIALLERHGYRVHRGPAQPDHPAGPALCLLAVRG
jgi:hypothetical protein